MSLFGSDNELGNILQEAVKLKSAQMNQKRQTYEKWPFFVQHTIFHAEKEEFKAWRELPFSEKIVVCEQIKEQGNESFAKGNWSDAVDKYEEAPSLVFYCYSTDPGWRKNNRGIDDDVIVFVDDKGSTEEDAGRQRKLRLACCLNLAACKQRLEKYDEAIVACDSALEIDPNNVKGLYRRAEARVRPSKSTAFDLDLAVKDLAKAHAVDPKNSMVDKLLTKLSGERKIQREKDSKTFTGMFDRGEIYDKNMEKAKEPCKSEMPMREIQERIENISDEDSFEKRCKDAELLRDLYVRNGKEQEAKELNLKIEAAKTALKEQTGTKPVIDWASPTPEMLADAQKYNLDLTDPAIVQELQRLEKEGSSEKKHDESSENGPQTSSRFPSVVVPSDVDLDTPIPWLWYAFLTLAIVVCWRLIRLGLLRWTFAFIWRRICSVLQVFGLASDDLDDDSVSIFTSIHRYIAGLFGGDDDGEL